MLTLEACVKRINHYLTTTIDHARPRFYTEASSVNKVNGARLRSMFAEISSAIRPHFSHSFGFSPLTLLFGLRFARKFTHLICFCWIWRTFVLIRILSRIFFKPQYSVCHDKITSLIISKFYNLYSSACSRWCYRDEFWYLSHRVIHKLICSCELCLRNANIDTPQ